MTHPAIESKQTLWQALQERLGHHFEQETLLAQALCHSSFANENSVPELCDNERLEFLGDAVLDLVVSQELLTAYPDVQEGELTRIRAEVVAEPSLANLARSLELGEALLLGRGERMSGGAERSSLLGDALEALFGAVFLDSGFQAAVDVIHPLVLPRIQHASNHSGQDYKSRLQEYLQAQRSVLPDYCLTASEGPDHDRTYHVDVVVGEDVCGHGQGRTKKRAEQAAAQAALESFGET